MKSCASLFSAALLALSLIATATRGATIHVSSVPEFESALQRATAGDRIVVQRGTYVTTSPLKVSCRGTSDSPVVIAAEAPGAVELRGSGGIRVNPPAAYVVIDGFRFTHQSGQTVIAAGAGHIRFTRNTFQCAGEGPYLTVTGDDAEVDRNEFRDKKTLGNMISVTGTGSQVARNLRIHHNYFHDFADAHGNGAETIRFGLSGLSMSTGGGVVEYNLFVRCEGENELISNKSSGNTYRYNTFLDAPGAQLTIRHGNDCLVYGNYFRNTDGLRVFGDRHVVVGNYFEHNRRGINLGNGDGEVADGAKLTSHDRPDGTIIACNSLIDNSTQYQMDGRKDGLGASGTVFAHNVISGKGKVAAIGGRNPGARWLHNHVAKPATLGDLPTEGATIEEAHFIISRDGMLQLAPGAAVPPSQSGAYAAPETAVVRDNNLDVLPALRGTTVRVLTPADVGPEAK